MADSQAQYAAKVKAAQEAQPIASSTPSRPAVKSVQVETEAEAQKRRDEANEDPLNREMRLKREAAAKATVESPVVLKPKS